MASSTSSLPNNSSRGAADATAGRIYFSTLSAHVRVPVGDLEFPTPPPPLLLTLYYLGENYPAAEKIFGGRIIIRRRNNYPGGRGWVKNLKKNICRTVSKTVTQCRNYPIPYLYTLSRTIPYLYTWNRTIPCFCTLNRTIT